MYGLVKRHDYDALLEAFGLHFSFGAMVVLEMLRWRLPAIAILLVVLLVNNGMVNQQAQVEYVELFAGAAAISMAFKARGCNGSAHDIRKSDFMDLMSPTGFLCLGSIWHLEI